MRRWHQGGTIALPAVTVLVGVAALLAAAIAEVARIELVVARSRVRTAAALARADACLAGTVAALPAGWDFAGALAGSDGLAGTADDGVLAAPPGCQATAQALPALPAPSRVLLTVEGQDRGGRRALEAIVGGATAPGAAALLWLSEVPQAGSVSGSLTLQGDDPGVPGAPRWAALAAPAAAPDLDAWVAAEGPGLEASAAGPPVTVPPPPLSALRERLVAAGASATAVFVAAGSPPPTLAVVAGDLLVAGTQAGAGLLFVEGSLEVIGQLDFTGVLVASGGVRIPPGGALVLNGTLWTGAPGATAALQVGGALLVRADPGALAALDTLFPLPRLPRLLGSRDLG